MPSELNFKSKLFPKANNNSSLPCTAFLFTNFRRGSAMPVLALAYKVAVTAAYFFFVGFLGSSQAINWCVTAAD